ncbi:MAG: hypothetical protein AAB426_09420 [Myxococcota bacterium]
MSVLRPTKKQHARHALSIALRERADAERRASDAAKAFRAATKMQTLKRKHCDAIIEDARKAGVL